MKRILVTGGAGFIGAHLVDRLVKSGHTVRVLDRVPVDIRPAWLKSAQIDYMLGDFSDHSLIDAALKDIDVVYHLVSTTIPASSNIDPIFDVQSNLVGTLSLLQIALKSGVKKVIFVSSGGTVYGKPKSLPIRETDPTDPICSYGITKLAIEKYLAMFKELHGLDFVVFRLANPFGERQRPGAQGAIAAFMHKVAEGKPIEIWGDGSVVRDYIYINDVIDAMVAGIDYNGAAHIFNLGSGQGRSLNEIIDTLRAVSGKPIECIYQSARALDVPKSVLDISLVKQEFNWQPSSDFAADLRRTWEWFSSKSV
ncbi:MAG: NAD-dependent epimerase/dehydratase family protein [Burkholderiaceae bacterium]|nr:NAD-dependent epimerase/dehydratase family protein [Burkholderiaceae bacterium]